MTLRYAKLADHSGRNEVDNLELIEVNASIRQHPIEEVGAWLRGMMTDMKKLN